MKRLREQAYSFPCGAILFGIIVIIFGTVAFKVNNERLDYPVIQAEVTKVKLEHEAYDVGDTHYDATYTVDIRYSVDGQEYEAGKMTKTWTLLFWLPLLPPERNRLS